MPPAFNLFLKYLPIWESEGVREKEREQVGGGAEGEGEAGSMQGAQRGTRSWVPRITPWAEGGAKPLSH